ncbi:MAG TPA: gliding motility-associated C-terminal domain-containing protein, partial [Chitinophagaceae bacterium]|nr:gliding motility-associated C-terminal domain-containing protein [Chitinophagaceae bacterium]
SDANGCGLSSVTTVTQPNALQWNTSASTPVSCNGGTNGSIVVHAIGGTGSLQYTLNPGAISNGSGNFSSLNSGTYTLQVVDANACSITTVLTVGTPPVLSISAGTAVPVSCYNGSNGQLSCSASGGNGGYTYTLNPGSVSNTTGIFTGLTAGTYSMSVSDILGCSQTLVATVSQPASLQIASINWVHPSCSSVNNGSITWSAGGGTPSYQYALNSGIFASLNTFNGLAGGMYTLHIKDNNNCVKDTQIQLIPQYAVTLNNILTQDILCKGDSSGSLSVTGAGGVFPYSYSLNGTAMGTVSNYTALPAGNYLVYVQDINGCSDDTLLQLLEPASGLGFNSVNILPVFCYGDQTGALTGFGLGGTAPYSFSLNGAPFQTSGTFSNLFAGNYTLQIRDANNCIHDTLLQVTQPSNPLFLYLKSLKDVSCVGKSDGELNTGCTGGTAPYQYFINGTAHGNDSTFLFLNAGTYTIEVKDVNGCSTSKLFIIGTPANNPIIVVNEIKENRCKADITGMIDWYALYGTPPYQFTFNGIFQDSVSNASNLFTGSYLIELKDKNGCQTDTTVSIRSSSDLNVTVQASPASCSGDGNDGKALASVSGGFSPYEYFWSGALTTGSSLNGIPQGSHSLVVKDMENCLDTAFYSIDYIPCCEVSMPNAFSPNNDGVNDIFRPVLYGIIELKSFEVYNRWGNCLFQTHQLLDGWNGIYSGSDCEIGTYYYLLSYYCQFSKEIQIKKGDFTLLR